MVIYNLCPATTQQPPNPMEEETKSEPANPFIAPICHIQQLWERRTRIALEDQTKDEFVPFEYVREIACSLITIQKRLQRVPFVALVQCARIRLDSVLREGDICPPLFYQKPWALPGLHGERVPAFPSVILLAFQIRGHYWILRHEIARLLDVQSVAFIERMLLQYDSSDARMCMPLSTVLDSSDMAFETHDISALMQATENLTLTVTRKPLCMGRKRTMRSNVWTMRTAGILLQWGILKRITGTTQEKPLRPKFVTTVHLRFAELSNDREELKIMGDARHVAERGAVFAGLEDAAPITKAKPPPPEPIFVRTGLSGPAANMLSRGFRRLADSDDASLREIGAGADIPTPIWSAIQSSYTTFRKEIVMVTADRGVSGTAGDPKNELQIFREFLGFSNLLFTKACMTPPEMIDIAEDIGFDLGDDTIRQQMDKIGAQFSGMPLLWMKSGDSSVALHVLQLWLRWKYNKHRTTSTASKRGIFLAQVLRFLRQSLARIVRHKHRVAIVEMLETRARNGAAQVSKAARKSKAKAGGDEDVPPLSEFSMLLAGFAKKGQTDIESLQQYLLLWLLLAIPPDRADVIRKLRVGYTLLKQSGSWVLHCVDHKTSAIHGPNSHALPLHTCILLEQLLSATHRSRHKGFYVFGKTDATKPPDSTSVNKMLRRALQETNWLNGVIPDSVAPFLARGPSLRTFRTVWETSAVFADLSPILRLAIACKLRHTLDTAARTYVKGGSAAQRKRHAATKHVRTSIRRGEMERALRAFEVDTKRRVQAAMKDRMPVFEPVYVEDEEASGSEFSDSDSDSDVSTSRNEFSESRDEVSKPIDESETKEKPSSFSRVDVTPSFARAEIAPSAREQMAERKRVKERMRKKERRAAMNQEERKVEPARKIERKTKVQVKPRKPSKEMRSSVKRPLEEEEVVESIRRSSRQRRRGKHSNVFLAWLVHTKALSDKRRPAKSRLLPIELGPVTEVDQENNNVRVEIWDVDNPTVANPLHKYEWKPTTRKLTLGYCDTVMDGDAPQKDQDGEQYISLSLHNGRLKKKDATRLLAMLSEFGEDWVTPFR